METIHDFEMTATRRPKVLVQTAGHVAGAAYYYQRKDVDPDAWSAKQVVHMETHIQTHTQTHRHTETQTHRHTDTHTDTHTHTHTHTHACMHAHTYIIHTLTCAHTHKQHTYTHYSHILIYTI